MRDRCGVLDVYMRYKTIGKILFIMVISDWTQTS